MNFPIETKDPMTHTMVNPADWLKPKGYSNGVLAEGRTLFVAGQIGWNAECRFECADFVGQTRQALLNIRAVVEAAGGEVAHITRLVWFVRSRAEYLASGKALGAAYREVLGAHFPAMTLVEVSALLEVEAQVEIEATAVIPS
jgi:enamine deaminase RidA (YjgF/YER057c/UK114 family)